MSVNSRAEFIKLQAASFVSQCGSHFLTLALSATIFAHTGSLVKGSAVFVLSYLPSVFFSSVLGSWIDSEISKPLIIGNEILAALASVLCGLSIAHSTIAFCCALALRSLFLFSSRTISAKWLKSISADEQQGPRIKLSFLIFFLATAVSGLLASRVLELGSLWTIVAIDVVTYLLGAAIFLALKGLPESSCQHVRPVVRPSLPVSLHAISAKSELREFFACVVLSQAIFQGAYSVLVNYLPIKHFTIGVAGTGLFQLAASLGIIAGFVLVWRRQKRKPGMDVSSFFWCGGILALLGTICLPISGSFLSFLILNLCYEAIWLDATASFFQKSPSHRIAEFQFTLSSIAALCMGMTTLIYAVAIQTFGTETIRYLALVSFVAIGSWHVVARDRNISEAGGLGR